MKKTTKQLIAILLAMFLLTTSVPASVFAASPDSGSEESAAEGSVADEGSEDQKDTVGTDQISDEENLPAEEKPSEEKPSEEKPSEEEAAEDSEGGDQNVPGQDDQQIQNPEDQAPAVSEPEAAEDDQEEAAAEGGEETVAPEEEADLTTSENAALVQSLVEELVQDNKRTNYASGTYSWDALAAKNAWNFRNGLMLQALLLMDQDTYTDFVKSFYRDNLKEDGTVKNYTAGILSSIQPAAALTELLDQDASGKYAPGVQYVYSQLEKQSAAQGAGPCLIYRQDASGIGTYGWKTYPVSTEEFYMVLPFLMGCAEAIEKGDLVLKDAAGEEVAAQDLYNLCGESLLWAGEKMTDAGTGLVSHGWSAKKLNKIFWTRGMGWYAMALTDVILKMPAGDMRDDLVTDLEGLFEAVTAYQDQETGMWYDLMNKQTDAANRLETSGSAMLSYAMLKAYVSGITEDKSVRAAGLAAFNGIAAEKLDGETAPSSLQDINIYANVSGTAASYLKSYGTNDASALAPLMMAAVYAVDAEKNQVERNALKGILPEETAEEIPEEVTEEVPSELTDEETGVMIAGSGAEEVTITDVSGDKAVQVAMEGLLAEGFVAYDITLEGYEQGTETTVSIPADGFDADAHLAVFYVPDDENADPVHIEGSLVDGFYQFTTDHFSTYTFGQVESSLQDPKVTASEIVFTLDTDGVDAGAEYLIANGNNGTVYALANSSGAAAAQAVTVTDGQIHAPTNAENCSWLFTANGTGSNTTYTVSNGSSYLYLTPNNVISDTARNITVNKNQNDSYYRLLYGNNSYLRYANNAWGITNNGSGRNIYLFKKTVGVSFTVSPASVHMQPGGAQTMTAAVSIGGDSYTNKNGNIDWTSQDESVARVSDDGTQIIGVGIGTTQVIAKLTSLEGTELSSPLEVAIDVTVTKPVASYQLTGVEGRTVKAGNAPDFSSLSLEVTYTDGTVETVTTANGLTVTGYNYYVPGQYDAKVMYQDEEYGHFRVTVLENQYAGLDEATTIPEYPETGAVRINKHADTDINIFNATGLTYVELDVAGVSEKKGVDVVLVVDVSNSMGWSLQNAGGANDAARRPTGNQTTKLQDAMTAADNFSRILLEDNTGAASDNTVSFVTFAGYDEDRSALASDQNYYTDSVMTVFTGETSYSRAHTSFSGTTITGTGNNYTLTVKDNNGTTLSNGENRGNTNYDYAFAQAADAVAAVTGAYTDYASAGREMYIVFMTDGAPSHYNSTNINQNQKNRDYIPGTNQTYAGTYEGKDAWTNYITTHTNSFATSLYNSVGGNFYAFGFDLAHGGFGDYQWTEAQLTGVIANMADGATIPVMATDNAETLNAFYESLATQIKYAGTQASAEDTIGKDYTLQMAAVSGTTEGHQATLSDHGITPSIVVRAYDLYTKADAPSPDLIGTRIKDGSGNDTYTEIETVTFNEDGDEAYSNQLGTVSIMDTDSYGNTVITAKYFTFTKYTDGKEVFEWNIGDITDKETALGFYVYLKGSLEGNAPEGIYYTNEEATLDYVDINGDHVTRTFPLPGAAWGGASTTYEFYLVNEKGEPVNRAGTVIPFANRITIQGPSYKSIILNADLTIDEQTVHASELVAPEYFLYDTNAGFKVQTTSFEGTVHGELTVTDPSPDASSFKGGKQQTGAQTTIVVSFDPVNYITSHVAFGVRWDMTPHYVDQPLTPKKVVMDYGKKIRVNLTIDEPTVTEKDEEENEITYNVTPAGLAQYNKNVNTSMVLTDPGAETFVTDNGSYAYIETTNNQKILEFTPSRMLSEAERVFAVMKLTNAEDANDFFYLYKEVDILPATMVYYETDFAEGVFTASGSWSTVSGSGSDDLQNDGDIGHNRYGYDTSYNDDVDLSNGRSLKAAGAGVASTTSEFSFTGTGFDLISRTGDDQGMIRVDIFSDEARQNRVKRVNVLNKSERSLELYQIPVVSVEGLAYNTYYVTIGVYGSYTNSAVPELSRGNEFFFDAVRIYDPAGASKGGEGDKALIYDAYKADKEADPSIQEIRNQIIAAGSFDPTAENDEDPIVVFIDRADEALISDYTTLGPNNEVYLTDGQMIVFAVTLDGGLPGSFDIGAKSADGRSVVLNVSVTPDLENYYDIYPALTSSTAQYFDLAENADSMSELFGDGDTAYVIVSADGSDGILSITDLKIAFGPATRGRARLASPSRAVRSLMEKMQEEPQVQAPNYDIVSAAFTTASVARNKMAVMEVVTSTDVTSLQVTNKAGKAQTITAEFADGEDGTRVWTVSFKATTVGNQIYTVTGYGADGTAGESASAQITVKLR